VGVHCPISTGVDVEGIGGKLRLQGRVIDEEAG
jgi:hypothetical protein